MTATIWNTRDAVNKAQEAGFFTAEQVDFIFRGLDLEMRRLEADAIEATGGLLACSWPECEECDDEQVVVDESACTCPPIADDATAPPPHDAGCPLAAIDAPTIPCPKCSAGGREG